MCLGVNASWETWLKRQVKSSCGEFSLNLRVKQGAGRICRGRMLCSALDSIWVFGIRVEATERQEMEREECRRFS